MCDDDIHVGLIYDPTVSRRTFGLAAVAVAGLGSAAHAQTNVVEKDVEVKTADGTADAALFYPSGKGTWPAVLIWTGLNLAALAWATRLTDRAADGTRLVLVCLSPPAVAMMMYGHFGGLLALGTTAMLRESDRRPWLAGLCFACLTVKPQFAAALGVILLCAGRWRCLIASGVATAVLVGISVAAFGL